MAWLLLASWLWPLLLTWPVARPAARRQRLVWALPLLGALPALATSLLLPLETRLELPWLFLGTALGLDATSQVYLLFTSLLWLFASVYSTFSLRGTAHYGRFCAFFLLAMAGNLWLIVGQDLFSFYAGFAMMGLASYGLVIHDGSDAALRAGKVYLVMALLGEVCLFAALVIIAEQTGSTEPSPEALADLTALPIGLALIGLGVKAGLVPLHLWLPLAHPAAPVPASAVLSGTMIKVAILGWLRFLPVGVIALPEWGGILAAGGLLTLFYALPVGLVQPDPKAILAYSSISKMGFMMLSLGLILIEPALAPLGVAGLALFAANHALVKGGLFLGVGLRKHAALSTSLLQPFILGAMIFLALALVGAPFTSGATAKYAVKPVLDSSTWPWVMSAVAVSTVGTTLLMARFVWVCARMHTKSEAGYLWPVLSWAFLLALVALFPFVLGQPASWLSNLVSVPLGLVLASLVGLLIWRRPASLKAAVGSVPPGDLIVPAMAVGAWFGHAWQRVWARLSRSLATRSAQITARFESVFASPVAEAEQGLQRWPVAGGLWLGVIVAMLLALFSSSPRLAKTPPSLSEHRSHQALEREAETLVEQLKRPAGAPEITPRQAPRPPTVPISRAPSVCPEPSSSPSSAVEDGAAKPQQLDRP